MTSPFVEISQVKKYYRLGDNLVHALRGVTCNINRGEIVALVGRSGSGKSTLLNLLGLLDTATEGQIKISGTDFCRATDDQMTLFRRHHIGYVFQTFNLLPVLNVVENVEYPLFYDVTLSPKQRREKAILMLERVGLKDFLQQRTSRLSGGQRQRVAIARALVTEPDLIIADEPTANLDSATSNEVMNIFFELNKNAQRTIIISTHDQSVMQKAHRILTLSDGVIVT